MKLLFTKILVDFLFKIIYCWQYKLQKFGMITLKPNWRPRQSKQVVLLKIERMYVCSIKK